MEPAANWVNPKCKLVANLVNSKSTGPPKMQTACEINSSKMQLVANLDKPKSILGHPKCNRLWNLWTQNATGCKLRLVAICTKLDLYIFAFSQFRPKTSVNLKLLARGPCQWIFCDTCSVNQRDIVNKLYVILVNQRAIVNKLSVTPVNQRDIVNKLSDTCQSKDQIVYKLYVNPYH